MLIFAALIALAWVAFYGAASWVVLNIDIFEDESVDDEEEWPAVSVIIPACNEGHTIRPALDSLRGVDYPDLEIVLIDDRSTDDTPEIVDALAADDDRIVAVHVDELPDGWLGKVHAMHVGLDHATGDFLLFTDADIHFAPDALRRAMSVVRRNALDHLTIVPSIGSDKLFLEAVMSAFGTLMFIGSRAHQMEDPDSAGLVGVGAFNLVRREAWERTPGMEWIRMDVADDSALAYMLSVHGAKQSVRISRTDVDVDWYPSVGALVRGLEKNLFGVGANYRVSRGIAGALALIAFVTGPFVVLAWPGGVVGLAACGVALGAMVVGNLVLSLRMGRRLLQIPLIPFAQLIVLYALVRSMVSTIRNEGITWRGTHYPLDELRRLQRFDL